MSFTCFTCSPLFALMEREYQEYCRLRPFYEYNQKNTHNIISAIYRNHRPIQSV